MKIVIDTSAIISGLLRDSIVRRIMTSGKLKFFVPEKAISEMLKYREYICKKTNMRIDDFYNLVLVLLKNIKIIPFKKIKEYLPEAESIAKEIDVNDSEFIATCFAIKADGIFTFDKDFTRQDKIKVFSTEELLRYINPARSSL